jgi:hypothetical protein
MYISSPQYLPRGPTNLILLDFATGNTIWWRGKIKSHFITQFSVVCVGYDTVVCSSQMPANVSKETVGLTYRASFPKL